MNGDQTYKEGASASMPQRARYDVKYIIIGIMAFVIIIETVLLLIGGKEVAPEKAMTEKAAIVGQPAVPPPQAAAPETLPQSGMQPTELPAAGNASSCEALDPAARAACYSGSRNMAAAKEPTPSPEEGQQAPVEYPPEMLARR